MKSYKNLLLILVVLSINACKTSKKNVTNDDLLPIKGLKKSIKCPETKKDSVVLLNVKDFGAEGNGITDDTKSIQVCFDSIEKLGSGKVFFPTGTYIVSRTNMSGKSWCLLGKDNIIIEGESKENAIIKLAANQKNFTRILVLENNKNVYINNITFDGNVKQQINSENPNEHLAAIFINETNYFRVCNASFVNTGGDGITIRGVKKPSSDIIIQNTYFNNNFRNGITLGSGFDGVHINNCFFGADIDDSPIDTEPQSGICQNVLIENNIINTPTLLSIGGPNANNPGRNFVVQNNILNDCAIFMVRADSVILKHNKINITKSKRDAITCLASNRAIYVDNNTINIKNKPAFYLVKTQYAKKAPRDIHIANNEINVTGSNTNAINIKGTNNVFIEDNNIIGDNSNLGIYCFSNYPMNNIFIKKNTISGFKKGIIIQPYKSNEIKNVKIKNNKFDHIFEIAIYIKHSVNKNKNLLGGLMIDKNRYSINVKSSIKK